MTRIVGIDPGSYHLGVGCVEKIGPNTRFVFADVLNAKRKDGFYQRLQSLSQQLEYTLASLSPDEIAIEDTFYAKNIRSAFQLGIARGVAVARCLEHKIPIHEYTPTQVKSVVTGHGRADKDQVKKMVQLILGTPILAGFDATDALAVAICHASIVRPYQTGLVDSSHDRLSARKNSLQEPR